MLASNFKGFVGVVIRKTNSNLTKNTIPTWKKAAEALGANLDDIPVVDMEARYPSGSKILFLWSDVSRDPDCLSLRGLEATAICFDEVDQLGKLVYDTAKTRVGRQNKGLISMQTGKPVDINPFFLASMNPNSAWTRMEFYDKWKDGTLPEDTYFVQSLPADNLENLGQEYIDMLETLGEQEKQRFLYGSWDYTENHALLIQYKWLLDCTQPKKDVFDLDGDVLMAIDPADCGTDSTVFSFCRGNTIFNIEEFKGLDTIGIVNKAKEFIKKYGVEKDGIIIDAVGIGSGPVSVLRDIGYKVAAFKGNAKPQKNKARQVVYDHDELRQKELTFKNANAQSAWILREDIIQQKIVFYDHKQLATELTALQYDTDDKNIILEKKKDIKKRIGKSPDFADCIRMLNYLRNGYCKKKKRVVRAITM